MKDSSWGRLIGVLFAPGETFRSIAERPTWLPPLLLAILIGLGLNWAIQQRVDVEQNVRDQAELYGIELTQKDVDLRVEQAQNPTFQKVGIAVAPLMAAAFYTFTAFLFWAGFRLFGSELGYVTSLSTLAYGLLPLLVGSLLNIPLVLSRDTLTLEETMAAGVLASNLGFLATEETGVVMRGLLQSADFFSIWAIVLLVIGYQTTAQVSRATAVGLVLAIWLFGVTVKLGLLSLPGLLMGGGA